MVGIRMSFDKIKAKYRRIGKGKVRLTQSSLLLLQPINASKASYKFAILEDEKSSTIQPEEIRLNINDEFISYNVGYYLVAEQSLGVDPFTPMGKVYLSYAPLEVDIAFATLARAWDATLSIAVNKISRLEKWDIKKHHMVPRTQYNSIALARYATQPSIDYSKDGLKAMQPMLTLSGAKKNEINLDLTNGAIPAGVFGAIIIPDKTTEPGTNSFRITATQLCLIFRGMLAQNASKFQ